MRSLLVIGSGAHGRVVSETAALLGYDVIGYADDNPGRHGMVVGNYMVLGGWADQEADFYFVAIGNNQDRQRIYLELISARKRLPILLHPAAYVSPAVKIGEGSIVLAGAVIQAGAAIGENVIINIAAALDHDAVVEKHSHVGPGAVLASHARLLPGELLPPGAIRLRS